jgi:SAM domain (Sterile alpha motif)
MDIVVWLRSLGLGTYEALFHENDIDEKVLLTLTAEDLKELGVTSFGHRRKLLDAIATLRGDASGRAPSVNPSSAPSPVPKTAPSARPPSADHRRPKNSFPAPWWLDSGQAKNSGLRGVSTSPAPPGQKVSGLAEFRSTERLFHKRKQLRNHGPHG